MLVKYLIPVLFLLPNFAIPVNYEDEWDGRDVHTRQWCRRLHSCQPENRTVCGWDETESFLAQFENICILYRANCKGAGKYHEVDMVICETRKNYSLTHSDEEAEFQWIHIENGTSSAATVVPSDVLLNKSDLRQNTQFRTLYPEGGTLPPGFFDTEEPLRQGKKSKEEKRQHKLRDAELRNELLELLWRRSVSTTVENVTRKRTHVI